MSVLIVDLDEMRVEKTDGNEKGLSGAVTLFNASPKECISISSSSEKVYEKLGTSVYSFVFTSPFTKKIDFSYDGGPFGVALAKLGLDVVLIMGSAEKLTYLSIRENKVELLPAEEYRGLESTVFENSVRHYPFDIVLSTSIAADNGILFASLLSGGGQLEGEGLGYAFFQRNLKGIVVQGFPKTDFTKKLKSKERKLMEKSHFSREIRKVGNARFIDSGIRLGWIPVSSYSGLSDPRLSFLDGKEVLEEYGNYPETCLDCFLSCYRRTKEGYRLPSYNEMTALGSNLGLFAIKDIVPIVNEARKVGLCINHLGALFAFLRTKDDEDKSLLGIDKGDSKGYVRLTRNIATLSGAASFYKTGLISEDKSIKTKHGKAIDYELRNCYQQALLSSLEVGLFLPSSMLLSKRKLKIKSAAISASYEFVMNLGLLSFGINPLSSLSLYWANVPSFIYSYPLLFRLYLIRFRILGYSFCEILEEGYSVFSSLKLEREGIPDYFKLEPTESEERRTVLALPLNSEFSSQILRLEKKVKSLKDKRARKEGKIKAAVAPSEDLG